ncbi:MAG: ferric reductase-like transmembrane domain-containing protein [Tissierellia bacterium]|nr:ferric reductase-like transmembrane domain-containing protein [Tissierellia bacterium]
MVYIVTLIYSFLFIRILGKYIGKKPIITYLITIVIAFFAVTIDPEAMQKRYGFFIFEFFMHPLYSGALAMSLFFFVMYCPVLPSKWKVTKLSRKNRTELSIIASILTLVHNLFYGFIDHHLFIEVFSNPFVYGKRYFVFTLSSAMAIILLIPLFITSFRTVRKKINPRSWKKIQKLAYPFWILIHLHVLLIYIDVFLNPSEFHGIFLVNAILNMIVYPLSLIIWIYLKIKQKNRKIAKSAH